MSQHLDDIKPTLTNLLLELRAILYGLSHYFPLNTINNEPCASTTNRLETTILVPSFGVMRCYLSNSECISLLTFIVIQLKIYNIHI